MVGSSVPGDASLGFFAGAPLDRNMLVLLV